MNYSLTGLIVPIGSLYSDDLQYGDREATTEEVEMYVTNKEIKLKVQDAFKLLNDTQWVESYILRHEQGTINIPYESNKWVIHAQRLDAIALLKEKGY